MPVSASTQHEMDEVAARNAAAQAEAEKARLTRERKYKRECHGKHWPNVQKLIDKVYQKRLDSVRAFLQSYEALREAEQELAPLLGEAVSTWQKEARKYGQNVPADIGKVPWPGHFLPSIGNLEQAFQVLGERILKLANIAGLPPSTVDEAELVGILKYARINRDKQREKREKTNPPVTTHHSGGEQPPKDGYLYDDWLRRQGGG